MLSFKKILYDKKIFKNVIFFLMLFYFDWKLYGTFFFQKR